MMNQYLFQRNKRYIHAVRYTIILHQHRMQLIHAEAARDGKVIGRTKFSLEIMYKNQSTQT